MFKGRQPKPCPISIAKWNRGHTEVGGVHSTDNVKDNKTLIMGRDSALEKLI